MALDVEIVSWIAALVEEKQAYCRGDAEKPRKLMKARASDRETQSGPRQRCSTENASRSDAPVPALVNLTSWSNSHSRSPRSERHYREVPTSP